MLRPTKRNRAIQATARDVRQPAILRVVRVNAKEPRVRQFLGAEVVAVLVQILRDSDICTLSVVARTRFDGDHFRLKGVLQA